MLTYLKGIYWKVVNQFKLAIKNWQGLAFTVIGLWAAYYTYKKLAGKPMWKRIGCAVIAWFLVGVVQLLVAAQLVPATPVNAPTTNTSDNGMIGIDF